MSNDRVYKKFSFETQSNNKETQSWILDVLINCH